MPHCWFRSGRQGVARRAYHTSPREQSSYRADLNVFLNDRLPEIRGLRGGKMPPLSPNLRLGASGRNSATQRLQSALPYSKSTEVKPWKTSARLLSFSGTPGETPRALTRSEERRV